MCLTCTSNEIYNSHSTEHFHLGIPGNHKVVLLKIEFISFYPKLVLFLDFFFTMVTGTTTYPIKPNTWETPMIPPSISIHNQVFIVLSSNTSYTYSFLFVLWPLPLFWQKSLNLFFCLGVLLCSCAICTLHKGTYWLRG